MSDQPDTPKNPHIGISPILIEDEMKNSYLEYAMSVIVGRALPDVRDGLKPVHRRILYAMYDAGYTSNRAYKKCARIVGDVLGRYHPHGDTAVYDSLVRMAQNFSLRYPLIDGQGNYGSIDGDNAAAMRYTEARMAPISMDLLTDIDKNTVEFSPNFDESLTEPTVLPSRVPTLLLNGASGIAVGMATNIPPHHLGELVNGICALLDNPDLEAVDLLQYIHGPDFPTGGIICGQSGIYSAYTTGRGLVAVRGKCRVEESQKKGKTAIIVDEIPYMVNKANLIIRIAELVQEKKISGISDLRDESDRKGMRIYIELKRDAQPDIVLNQLYKHTQLQTTFGINMVALVNGIPRTLTLKQCLTHYIDHRKDVIVKRTAYDLGQAQSRLHILEGLRIALSNIDEIIALIKAAETVDVARSGLISTYGLSERQANAILEMRLQRLTGLERDKIESEYRDLVAKITDLQNILDTPQRVVELIRSEHLQLQGKYENPRRTEIAPDLENLEIEDLIPDEQVAVLFTSKGFVKRMPVHLFRSQLRGGRGISSIVTRDEDAVENILVTSTKDFVMCFTSLGRVFRFKVYKVPEASRQSKGVSISHFIDLANGETITATIPITDFESEDYLFMTTQNGVVKKTMVRAFSNLRNRAIIAIDLDEGDTLRWVHKTTGTSDIMLLTSSGMIIRFSESEVRPLSRDTRGVRGITMKSGDRLVCMGVVAPDEQNLYILLITTLGYGKTTKVSEFRNQRRAGIGVKSLRLRNKDAVTDAVITTKDNELMIVTEHGTLCRQQISNIPSQRRGSQGVRIVKLDSGDRVTAIEKVSIDLVDKAAESGS